MAEISVRVRGLDAVTSSLRGLPDKLRRRALRNALAAGARIVRDEARRNAPVLRKPDPRRKPGTVRDAITVRTSKSARRAGDVGVFVNVKPLKAKQIAAFKASNLRGARNGASNPNDPFYWRWLEFGRAGRPATAAQPARGLLRGGVLRTAKPTRARRAVGPLPAAGFLQRAAGRLGEALAKFEQVLGPALERIANRQEP